MSFNLTKESDGTAMTLEELVENIVCWGEARGIIQNGKPETQMLKLMEEMGELANAIAKNDDPMIKDSIGDCIVVLIMIACQCSMGFDECVDAAWDEIKDRRGFLNEKGIFEKE